MDRPYGNVGFSNPWSTPSLPCLDGGCQLRFPDHDTRYEHYVASHPYSRPWPHRRKPLRCRLCLKAFEQDSKLKLHIKSNHKPTASDLGVTREDQVALILQSHVPTTDRKRSEPQKENGDTQGHRIRRQDEGTEEPLCPVPSRRNSLLQNRAVQYLKRKGSQIVAPLTKKARKALVEDTGDHPTHVG